ncbi:MAG: hypothetical protein CVU69_00615 [Deltaproteobacteria bacterium HGW-Deltaproteobacteria-4]|nr:MAG: hypothetical protein CVU69_00615 [Deltaproteobacteria bacterium HGW-Deltaproteobacteria-4]
MSDQQSDAARQLRQRAEEKARQLGVIDLQSLSPEETQQMLHELRVHQIELELQNEELRRTQHELEISRSRYFDLYDLAPVGYLTLNEQGLIKEVNLATATLLGTERKNLLKRPISSFIFPDDQDRYYLQRKKFLETHEVQDRQIRLLRSDGSPLWVRLLAAPLHNGEYGITIINITERKRIEEALIKSEESIQHQNNLFSTLLNNLPIGVFMAEVPSGKPLVVNDAAVQLLGREIIPDASRQNLAEVYKAFKQGSHQPYPAEEMPILLGMKGVRSHVDDMVIERPDGSEVLLEIIGSPVKDEQGKIWASLVNFSDITARKAAENELKETKNLLSLFIKNSPVYAYIKEVNSSTSRVVMASENFQEMIGIPGSKMTGKTMQELFPPEMAAKIFADDKAVVTGNKILLLEEEFNDHYYQSIKFPIIQGKKTLLAGYTIDMTERKRAEKVLRESFERLANVLDNIDALIYIADMETYELLFVNAYGRKTWGSYLGQKCWSVFQKDQNGPCAFCTNEKLLNKDGQPTGVHAWEFQNTANGRWFDCRDVAIPWTDGRTVRMEIATDITERKKTEEELITLTKAAESANTAKSQFLANMSHEIRTPMNAVVGLIELLLNTELNREQREYAELVKISGKNLVELISNILDLSKIEAHKIELEEACFNLNHVMNGTMALFTLRAKEKGLNLRTEIAPDVPLLLKGDVGRLRQIITNLVSNAIKFTERGSVALHISKEKEDDQHAMLRFQVEDSGIGITAVKIEEIFQPFTQADNTTTRRYGGTGLGLTIARQLAELMGGTVGVVSQENVGTTFWFTAVFTTQSERRRAPRNLILAKEATESPFSSIIAPPGNRILIAEDDLTNQLMIKTILGKFGYQVDVANNGAEALNLLEKADYALVLMDCMMPVLNGFETTAVIRDPTSAVRNHAIPVVALTAKAFKEDRASCLAAGMDDYLAKPIDIKKVLAVLEKWVTSCPISAGEN